MQKIINGIFVEGQLDECDLTLRDLHLIANSFVRILTGIFPPPDRVSGSGRLEEGAKKRSENGDQSQKSAAEGPRRDGQAKKSGARDAAARWGARRRTVAWWWWMTPRSPTLNRTYRGVAGPTDVLAFPMTEGAFGGSPRTVSATSSISAETAARQARWGDLRAELALLLVHGILHLVGYDHGTARDRQRMWKKQAAILSACGIQVPDGWAELPSEMSALWTAIRLGCLGFALLLFLPAQAIAEDPPLALHLAPAQVKQGGVAALELVGAVPGDRLRVRVGDREIPLGASAPGAAPRLLIGVDLEQPPGSDSRWWSREPCPRAGPCGRRPDCACGMPRTPSNV